jgi:hypothetical protein
MGLNFYSPLAKVFFYGLYLYNLGQVQIWPFDWANQENTVAVLKRLRVEFPDVPIKLVWNGTPYHRAHVVREAAQTLDIGLYGCQILCPWSTCGTGCGRMPLT